ncbi:MAG TPA: DUF1206 domain-containing protein [Sphingomicrobium sp.]|nr:DUF1206 domain-containing protein [Sphingomicrobium sp.]
MNRARHIETWARLGYFARGIVYLIIGWLALDSNRPMSAGEAVKSVEQMPLGSVLLALLALGLFGYGLYKIGAGLADLDGDGQDGKALAKRGGRVGSGLAYWLLAFIAAKAMLDEGATAAESGQASGSGGAASDAARQVSDTAGGDLLVVAIGLVILVVAAVQLYNAAKAKFMDEMEPGAPRLVKPAGQAGYAARGIVFLIIGWFALQAGLDGARLRGFGDALAVLRDDQPLLFKLIAAGLLLFGAVSIVMARYRHVRDADLRDVARNAADPRV